VITEGKPSGRLFIVEGLRRNFPTSFDEGLHDEASFREEPTRISQANESKEGGGCPPLQFECFSAATLRSFSAASTVKP